MVLPQPAAQPEQHTGRVAEARSQPGQQVSLDTREQCEQHITDLAIEPAPPAADAAWPARGAESCGSGTSRGRSRIQGRLHLAQVGILVGTAVLGQQRVGYAASPTAHAQHSAQRAPEPTVVPGVVSEDTAASWEGTSHHRTPPNLLGVVVSSRGGDSERGSGLTRWRVLFRPRTSASPAGQTPIPPAGCWQVPASAGRRPRSPRITLCSSVGGAVDYAAEIPVSSVGGIAKGRRSPVRQQGAGTRCCGGLQSLRKAPAPSTRRPVSPRRSHWNRAVQLLQQSRHPTGWARSSP